MSMERSRGMGPGSVLAATALLLWSTVAAAQTVFTEDASLVGLDAANGWMTGTTVALDNGTALFGIGNNNGAYFFRQRPDDSWAQNLKVFQSIGYVCSFGREVALNEGVAMVADPYLGGYCDGSNGTVTEFTDTGSIWAKARTLMGPSSPGFVNKFGSAVAIRQNTLLVGAEGDFYSPDLPAALFFERRVDRWIQQQVVSGNDTIKSDGFGHAVALNDDGLTAVIGAHNAGSPGEGATYVFEFDGHKWHETQQLFAGSGQPNTSFGYALAMESDVIVVGAPSDDQVAPNGGSVDVFRHNGSSWVQDEHITAEVSVQGAAFGGDVALKDGHLAIGAYGENAVYIYRNVMGRFLFLQRLVASHPALAGRLGFSVDVDGFTCLAGAPYANFVAPQSGAVHVFTIQELALTANTSVAQGGETVELATHGGVPGTPCYVSYRLSSGLSAGTGGFEPGSMVSAGAFDIDGYHGMNFVVAPALAGSEVTIRTHGLYLPAAFGTSNPVRVALQ